MIENLRFSTRPEASPEAPSQYLESRKALHQKQRHVRGLGGSAHARGTAVVCAKRTHAGPKLMRASCAGATPDNDNVSGVLCRSELVNSCVRRVPWAPTQNSEVMRATCVDYVCRLRTQTAAGVCVCAISEDAVCERRARRCGWLHTHTHTSTARG